MGYSVDSVTSSCANFKVAAAEAGLESVTSKLVLEVVLGHGQDVGRTMCKHELPWTTMNIHELLWITVDPNSPIYWALCPVLIMDRFVVSL